MAETCVLHKYQYFESQI